MARKGVSLVELLLVIAIITILAGLTIPFYRGYQIEQGLDTQSKDVVQVLREAQNMAITGKSDSEWGVHFDSANGEFGLYRGMVFSEYYYNDAYRLEGYLDLDTDFGDDVYFYKVSGEPSVSGTVDVHADNGSERRIEINSEGLINLGS